MRAPLFSIIIPVYNVEKYIDQCINSVLKQTCSDYEIILVDDGSPDMCGEICDRYAKSNANIRVIHKKNAGLSMARNDGLENSTGTYVLFLDSDDYWDDDNFLKQAKNRLEEIQNIDILIFGTKKLFNGNKIKDIRIPKAHRDEKPTIKQLMQENSFVVCAWDKIVYRQFLTDNNVTFAENQLSEDFEWCIKLLLSNPMIDVLDISPHVYRQQNANSITSNISRKNIEDICNVFEKYRSMRNNLPLMNFLAEEYVLWMIPTNYIKKADIIDLLARMKNHYSILEYDWYPNVKRISKFKIVGFELIRKGMFIAYQIMKRR